MHLTVNMEAVHSPLSAPVFQVCSAAQLQGCPGFWVIQETSLMAVSAVRQSHVPASLPMMVSWGSCKLCSH